MSTIIVSTPVVRGLGKRFRAHGLKLKSVVLFDTNTRRLFGEEILRTLGEEGFSVLELTVPSRENSKSFSTAFKLYGRMIEAGVDRSWNLICVGGGVVGDLGGFIAASYYRGIPVVQIPTTLLAMTDSSIGGKVAINHPLGKNLIGFFHLPELVLIDPSYLRTLPKREIYSGLSEVVKYGFIADGEMFGRFEENFGKVAALEEPWLTEAVRRSAEIKQEVVEKDFCEMSGLRATLNFGHTFAHGLEKLADYRFIRHGEAVTLGMACALFLSHRLGHLDRPSLERGLSLIAKFRFPRNLLEKRFLEIEGPLLLENMLSDKKKLDSRLRFVLLRSIGEAFLLEEDVDDRDVLAAIEEAKEFFRNGRCR